MADAQLVLSPLVRVTDANNQPIAGGELRFYEAGTSTPLVVYADSDLLVALGSTVDTDDGGYPISGGGAKTLIWTGPDEYKVVVHDADGVPLVTHDNIRGALVVPEAAEASYPKTPVITRTTTTVISTDYESYRGRLINANPGGGSFVITLPSAVTVEDGFRIGVRHAGTSNTVTIRTIGTQVIATIGQAALKSFALTGLGNTVWLVSNGADWIVDTEVPALINNSYFIVADRLTSPPGSPVAGTRYIINGMPAGAWSTLSFDENDIAESDGNGSWFRYVPRDGYLAYVADENLLTQWRDSEWVDLTNITAPTESQLQYAVFEHQVSNGTNGGTATTGAWTNRTLNTTVINTITGASLGSNAITLPVGKYLVLAQQAFFSREAFDTSVGARFVAQQRINAGTAVLAANSLYGMAGTVGTTLSVRSATGNGDTTYAPTDMFVLDVTTAGTINLQYYTTNSQTGHALGLASTEPANAVESYARVTVMSLASLQGPQGIQGSQGNAATIAVGTVTTVAPGVPAAVTNSGTSGAAVFDFDIPKGETGGSGSSGGAVLAYFEWNAATSGDPGSGGVLANNADLASATAVHISKTGPNGEDYGAFLASWAVSTAPLKGHLRINTAADLSEFIDADVTGFTDNSTYVTIALTNVTGSGTPTASDDMSVLFMRSGDLGSISVPDYTALKALPPTGAVIVTDPNRGGTFVWRSGDYSALVTADTAEGNYVASNADPTGAAGCWVRLAPGTGRIDALSSRVSIDLAAWGMSVTATASANTAAFTAAMAYLASRNGGKATFPAGTLNVNTLTIGTSDIDVVGHGAGTWLINNTTNAPAVHIDGAINNSTLRDVRIGQSASVSPTTGNCGVRAEDCFNARIESVFCIPFPAALHKGFIFDNTDETRISDLWASSCVDIGFDFTNGCSGFSGHTLKSFSNGNAGFRFNGVSGFWVNALHAFGNDTYAFYFSDPGGGGVNQFFFCSGWVGDTSANTNWLISNLNRSSFSNSWASTQKSAAVNTSASGIVISGSLCFDIDLIGLQVVFNNAQGLLITNSANNIRVHGGTYGAQSSTGHGNGRSGAGSGIRLELVTDIIVSGVRARGNATNGLLATGVASDYLMIRGNNFRGNTGSSLVNSSTGANNNVGENIT